MKKILIFIALFIGLAFISYAESINKSKNDESINESKTDIYYGNGVWNDYDDAYSSCLKLEKRIINN